MADTKWSALPTTTTPNLNDEVALLKAGANLTTEIQYVRDLISANLNITASPETFTADVAESDGPTGTFIAGTSTTVTLNAAPSSIDSLSVQMNGLTVDVGYTLLGSVVTFLGTIPDHTDRIDVRILN